MKIKSKGLVKVLKDQRAVNEDIQAIHKELVEADAKHKKLQYKVQRIKEKGLKILHKALIEAEALGEFDYTGQMEIIDDEHCEVQIHNVYDTMFRDPKSVEEAIRKDKKEKTGVWADELMFTGHK